MGIEAGASAQLCSQAGAWEQEEEAGAWEQEEEAGAWEQEEDSFRSSRFNRRTC
ncbi:hypothetical protein [Desulfoglaeba alkanexedens]|uniref:hypothetical protein n=1 Tax=Desulfoglaeba alkanexedens TaxID=361111 RepID=UPI001476EFCC|nr:hypothetical protein [Desulfoglaeba alkanexedens]